jgi:hypothetical protein
MRKNSSSNNYRITSKSKDVSTITIEQVELKQTLSLSFFSPPLSIQNYFTFISHQQEKLDPFFFFIKRNN